MENFNLLQIRAEPGNQARLVPGPEPDRMKIFEIYFEKIKSTLMPVHHEKGQPDPSSYVREKGCPLTEKHPVVKYTCRLAREWRRSR